MQSSNIPSKIPLPFGYAAGSGYINPIPTASQIGIVNGRASLHDGFPPDTFTPVTAGGVPPFGGDFNGILNEITAIQQWQEAGGFFPFDASFASTVGGYPKGAMLQSSSFNGFWISTIENNSNNPDTGGAGWNPVSFYGVEPIALSGSSVTVSNIVAAYPILILNGTLTTNCNLILPNFIGSWIIQNNTSGAYTVQVKTASGTGVNVNQGYSTYIYGDGTNINYANSAEVASFNGRSGAVTLNGADVINALGWTPVQQGGGAGQGTNKIFLGWDSGQLKVQVDATDEGALTFLNQFGNNLGTYGYQVFPNGLMIQWGQNNLPSGGGANFSFPWSFSNTCNQMIISDSGGSAYAYGAGNLSAGGYSAWVNTSLGATFRYLAIGY